MDFTITQEQKELYNETVAFARQHLNDERYLDEFSYDMWRKTAEFGLFGISAPKEYGGMEESYLTSALVIEALGYGCINNGFVFAVNNHIWVGLNLIQQYGSDVLKSKYLSSMVDGSLIGAIAITEADAGSDAHAMKANVREVDDGYILNGNKMFISNGTIADIFIVFAKMELNGRQAITAFVVEKKFDGVTVGKDIEKMGLNSCPMAELTFSDCFIPKENVLGKPGNGDIIMKGALEWERCYEFACHVGAMERVMNHCIEYANQREQFGKDLTAYQAVTHKIADMKMKIELARLMLYKIAWLKDQNKKAYLETSIFKLFVSESYIQTCKDAMQIFGAYGYTREYGLEREMRDALACSIYSGTNEMQRNTIYNITSIETTI
jgi:hypothetical protein